MSRFLILYFMVFALSAQADCKLMVYKNGEIFESAPLVLLHTDGIVSMFSSTTASGYKTFAVYARPTVLETGFSAISMYTPEGFGVQWHEYDAFSTFEEMFRENTFEQVYPDGNKFVEGFECP